LRACALVLNSSHRMASMISTLLDFTRARMGPGLPISVRPADLALISEATVEECRARYPGAVIEVRRVGDLSGRWDPDRLEQVIGNLTENAVQHGGGDSPILVTVEDHGNDVCISVSNEGIIAAEERASIFDPLRRAALMKSSRSGGLGLGLYIVREICHMHGGSISVESEEDKGTTFTVKLPRFSEADQP